MRAVTIYRVLKKYQLFCLNMAIMSVHIVDRLIQSSKMYKIFLVTVYALSFVIFPLRKVILMLNTLQKRLNVQVLRINFGICMTSCMNINKHLMISI